VRIAGKRLISRGEKRAKVFRSLKPARHVEQKEQLQQGDRK